MSLVNDMLRDLEQRDKAGSELGSATPIKAVQRDEFKRESRSHVKTITLTLLSILILLLLLIWVLFPKNIDQLLAEAENHMEAIFNSTEAQVSLPSEDVKLDVIPTNIVSIRWSGTNDRGDLVVELDGEADIQLVSQESRSITVAFEDVQFDSIMPVISNSLVESLDMYRGNSRTELTLTTKLNSQFSFKVQHSPSTMVLGIIPKEVRPVVTPQQPKSETVAVKTKKKTANPLPNVQAAKTNKQRSGQAVQTKQPKDVARIAEAKKTLKSVKKVSGAKTDRQVINQARSYIRKGQPKKAQKLLEKHIAEQPEKSLEARGYLAGLLFSSGQLEQAQKLLEKSLQLYPEDNTLRKVQARLLLERNSTPAALNLLQQSPPELAVDTEYHELLAKAYQKLGSHESAAKTYYALLKHDSNIPRWWVGMAYSLELDKRHKEALRAYLNAVQIPEISASLKNYAEQRIKSLTER